MSLFLLLNACKEDGMGKNADGQNTFTYEPIGWTMVLPEGWTVLSATERDKLDYAAENFYEEANNGKKKGAKKIILGVKKRRTTSTLFMLLYAATSAMKTIHACATCYASKSANTPPENIRHMTH